MYEVVLKILMYELDQIFMRKYFCHLCVNVLPIYLCKYHAVKEILFIFKHVSDVMFGML